MLLPPTYLPLPHLPGRDLLHRPSCPVAPLDPATSPVQVLFVVPALKTLSHVPVSRLQLPSLPGMGHRFPLARPPPGISFGSSKPQRGAPPPGALGTAHRVGPFPDPTAPPRQDGFTPASQQALPVAGAQQVHSHCLLSAQPSMHPSHCPPAPGRVEAVILAEHSPRSEHALCLVGGR